MYSGIEERVNDIMSKAGICSWVQKCGKDMVGRDIEVAGSGNLVRHGTVEPGGSSPVQVLFEQLKSVVLV